MFEYGQKLQKQFELFYYMQQHRKLNIIEEIMFNPIEQKYVNLISKKYYKVSLNDGNVLEKKKEIEKNDELIEYILEEKESGCPKTR